MNCVDDNKEYVPIKSKFAFGGLSGTIALLSGMAFSAITFYYNVKLGLSAGLLGIGWLIFAIWNALSNLLFGFIEDKTKSKYGRRIPYLRFGAPLFGILFILCWFPFVNVTNELALFVNFLVVLFLFNTLFTIIGLVGYSLPAEMCVSSKERARIIAFGTISASFGYIISFVLPLFLLTGDKSKYINPLFLLSIVIIGILGALIVFISSYFLKENIYTQMEEPLGFIDGIKEALKNKPFIKFEISNFSYILAQTILTTGVFYYVAYVLILGGLMAIIPVLVVFAMIFIFVPIFSKLAGKYGLKKVYIIGLAIAGLGFFLNFILGWNLITAVFPLLLIGIGLSAIMLLRQAITADIIDYDETRTGKRRETSYAGMNAVFEKPAISIANWLFLFIIVLYGFQQMSNTQSFGAKVGIMMIMTVIPAIFLALSVIIMLFYPLDGPEWDKKKNQLIKLHENKEKIYIQCLKGQNKIQ
ncbi:MAG TPA: MFS transporter [Candidatus Lokiarchaeia archaeon]